MRVPGAPAFMPWNPVVLLAMGRIMWEAVMKLDIPGADLGLPAGCLSPSSGESSTHCSGSNPLLPVTQMPCAPNTALPHSPLPPSSTGRHFWAPHTHTCTPSTTGGCFWGLELAYQRVPGVVSTTVGYTQGTDTSPTYDAVCSGTTGHTEAVQCAYDEKDVSYDQLLDLFFNRVDPTTLNRQNNDRGTQVSAA